MVLIKNLQANNTHIPFVELKTNTKQNVIIKNLFKEGISNPF